MSYITFDYKCPNCDAEYPDCFVKRDEMDSQRCGKCKEVLARLPAGPSTTFKFGDRSAIKSKKAVSLRDPNPGVTRKFTPEDAL
jgi:ribosomal protein L37AE/L43A